MAPRVIDPGLKIEPLGLSATLLDLSESGALIDFPLPPARGQTVWLNLQLNERQSITVRAQVRRVEEGSEIGVEFLKIADADRRLLRDWIAERVKRETRPAPPAGANDL